MDFSGLSLLKLNHSTIIKPFDCGDEDLNDFVLNSAIHYHNELLAKTYILEDDKETVAFFSIFNDSLKVQEKDFASRSAFNRFLRNVVSHPKRHLEHFPAIKIGRLAVKKDIQKSGIGTAIINFIIDLAIQHNEHCACKFISVDAYKDSLLFYEKKGFLYYTPKDEGEDTRQMYLNITPIINTAKDYISN